MGARAGLLFAAMAAIWGVPYLLIKIAVDAGLLLILAGSWLSTGGGRPPGALVLAARVARMRAGPRSSRAS
jgi:hypothetical protein